LPSRTKDDDEDENKYRLRIAAGLERVENLVGVYALMSSDAL
jgi:hypothetical protein